MRIAYLNNKFLPLDKAKVPILDRGFLYGDGVFETMRSYEGIVFRLEKHIARLFGSLKALGIRPKIAKYKIEKIVYKLLKKNKLKDVYVKIIVTRGANFPTFLVYALPYVPPPENIYKKGARLYVSETRLNEKSEIAGHKTLNYLHNILCRYKAEQKACYDAVLINTDDFIAETTSSNIFLVKRKKIYTPSVKSGILPGITRSEVMRLANKNLKNRVNENFMKIDALYEADEVFLTNSLVEIMPVTKIGKHIVGAGGPGPITKNLMSLYRDAVREYCRR